MFGQSHKLSINIQEKGLHMDGMSFMMKSFGFDPKQIQEKLKEAQDRATIVLNDFTARLDALQKQQNEISAKLDKLISIQDRTVLK
jgi:hypothetical protein